MKIRSIKMTYAEKERFVRLWNAGLSAANISAHYNRPVYWASQTASNLRASGWNVKNRHGKLRKTRSYMPNEYITIYHHNGCTTKIGGAVPGGIASFAKAFKEAVEGQRKETVQ